jgi:hypothetical protein
VIWFFCQISESIFDQTRFSNFPRLLPIWQETV